ncbi:hypothetical protein EVAR_18940_1 [Eumeta japonica]|uniref:Uncharacterized protein n=1 Tax=Eumeta variegata TaxID=151549 RepID=A0A4C1V3D1_EUMVA|nr:hypothetical protein EVAR_18940_1 [Eumeta japonica]
MIASGSCHSAFAFVSTTSGGARRRRRRRPPTASRLKGPRKQKSWITACKHKNRQFLVGFTIEAAIDLHRTAQVAYMRDNGRG